MHCPGSLVGVEPPAAAVETRLLPRALMQALRTDHAGETGAVMIYRGVLAVARDPALRRFAEHHLATEQRHLRLIEPWVARPWRSRLLPLWRVAGWLTGALPALAGPRAVYATVQAVETFVDRHYAEQLHHIDHLLADGAAPGVGPTLADPSPTLRTLRALLAQCRDDEIAHRDDAGARWDGRARGVLAAWCSLVARGSAAAVRVCRVI